MLGQNPARIRGDQSVTIIRRRGGEPIPRTFGGDAHCVALARGFLDDRRWAWHAAAALGTDAVYPPSYLRARAEHLGGRSAHPAPTGAGEPLSQNR